MFRFAKQSLLVLMMPLVIEGCGSTSSDAGDDESGSDKALSGASGTVFNTGGIGLNVRAKPSLSAAVIASIPAGKTVKISCQTSGDSVSGTSVWDYLPAYGGYVSDAFLYTGTDGFLAGVPKCGSSSNGSSGSVSGCGSLDYIGKCHGDVLSWCEAGTVHEKDCSDAGRSCKYQDDAIGYNCVSGSGGSSSSGGDLLTVGEIVGGDYEVTQAFGPTDFDGGYSYCHDYGDWDAWLVHCGVDIGIPNGTPLKVPGDGTVLRAGGSGYYEDAYNPAAGELKIQLANGADVILGHMSEIDLYVGQSVAQGESAGLSGQMNGPHVHIEVRVPDSSTSSGQRAVDPMTYFGW